MSNCGVSSDLAVRMHEQRNRVLMYNTLASRTIRRYLRGELITGLTATYYVNRTVFRFFIKTGTCGVVQ